MGDFRAKDISKGSCGSHKQHLSTAYLRAGIINARRTGQSVNLRGREDPEDLSILSSAMGITQG